MSNAIIAANKNQSEDHGFKRRLRRQACGGKTRYRTEQAARQGLAKLRQRTRNRDVMSTYRCKFCHQFHFGHAPAHVRQAMTSSAIPNWGIDLHYP